MLIFQLETTTGRGWFRQGDSPLTEIISNDIDDNTRAKLPIELQDIKTTTVYEINRETGIIVTGKVFNSKGRLAWYDKPQWNDKKEMIGSMAYDGTGKMIFKTIQYKSVNGKWEILIVDENGYEIKQEEAMAITLKLVSAGAVKSEKINGASKF